MLEGTKRGKLATRASVHLDMIRGMAAVAVLAGHLRGLFFHSYHELARHSVALGVLYAATGLGHQAVMVFFVLSGFFIVSSSLEAMEKHQWSWKIYLVNRIVRLSLVLTPALVLTWLVDQLGMAMSASAPFYHRELVFFFTVNPANYETVRNFIGNFFYLQGILVQPFGSNGPLWSLSYEFWYYLLFPLALCVFIKRSGYTKRAVCLLLAGLVGWFIGKTIALYFLLWLLGGTVAHSFLRQKSPAQNRIGGALTMMLFVASLALSLRHPIDVPFLLDAAVALGFGLWMYALVRAPNRPVAPAYAKIAGLFAGFSYTLYATHFPLLFLFRARFIGDKVWAPDGLHLFYGLLITAAAVAIAWAIAQVTEAKTAEARRTVMSWLPGEARPVPQNS